MAGGAGALLLRRHRLREAVHVQAQAALAGDVGGEIRRKAVGVVEPEHRLARNLLVREVGDDVLEDAQPLLQRVGEAFLLGLQHPLDMLLPGAQFRIGIAHLRHQRRNQAVKERLLLAELVTVADRTTNDAALHVAAALVARGDAVQHQEGGGADMIGDHAQGLVVAVSTAGGRGRRIDEGAEQVDVVIAVHALHDRGQTLEPHARIHRRMRQRRQLAARHRDRTA